MASVQNTTSAPSTTSTTKHNRVTHHHYVTTLTNIGTHEHIQWGLCANNYTSTQTRRLHDCMSWGLHEVIAHIFVLCTTYMIVSSRVYSILYNVREKNIMPILCIECAEKSHMLGMLLIPIYLLGDVYIWKGLLNDWHFKHVTFCTHSIQNTAIGVTTITPIGKETTEFVSTYSTR